MSNRYDDRDYDRGGTEASGRRRDSEYGRSSERTQERYRWGRDDDDDDRNERFAGESRWGGQYGRSRFGNESSGSGREYGSGRGEFSGGRDYSSGGSGWEGRRGHGGGRSEISRGYQGGSGWQSDRDYSNEHNRNWAGGSRGSQQNFGQSSSNYSQRYGYPSDYPSRGMHSNQGGRTFDYDRSRFGRGQEGGYEYDRDQYGSGAGDDRGWWDRASDAVASWFGDEEAERRRRMDRREEWRGKGPKGYRRSDERIREDINDRLSEGYLDASDVEVTVSNAEVTLTGTVNNRWDKRRAEDITESVNGVTHVENRIRVKQHGSEGYGSSMTSDSTSSTMGTSGAGTGTTGTTGTGQGTGTTGTTGTTSSSAAAGGTGTRSKS